MVELDGRRYRDPVGSTDPRDQGLLEQARVAHREHRYDVAYETLRSALAESPLEPDDLHRFAEAAWWLGMTTECLRLTEDAHRRFLATGHVEAAAAQALDLGGMLAMRGEMALASGWLGRARRLLADQPIGPTHGVLWYADVSEALAMARLDDATRTSEELRRLGERLDDDTLTALGLVGSALADLRRGRVDMAFGLLDEAMLRVVAGRVTAEWAGHIYCTMVASCLDVADLNRARQWSDAALRWLNGFSDAVMFTGVCRAHSVNLLVAEGAWDSAEREAGQVVQELRDLNVEAVAEAEYQCGEAHRLRGDLDGADACFERAESMDRDPQPGRALLQMARGDADGAWFGINDAVGRHGGDPFRCAQLLRAQVRIGLAAGHLASAAGAARRLRERADLFDTPGFRAWADHAQGAVELASSRAGPAIEPLTRACAAYRAMHCWYDAAEVESLLGEAHQTLGEDDAAREHREASESGFRRLGVRRLDGDRPTDDGGLTQRELEVLGRVATGLSNRDTARELMISEATVRRHLANIYLKLGVGSRTAAAAWAHENRLVHRSTI